MCHFTLLRKFDDEMVALYRIIYDRIYLHDPLLPVSHETAWRLSGSLCRPLWAVPAACH